MERLGVGAPTAAEFILPLTPLPDGDARHEAIQRLRDPELRLLDELFWFWPLEMNGADGADEALAALKRGDHSQAIAVWERYREPGDKRSVAIHNLAVLSHLLALELELPPSAYGLLPEEVRRRRVHWNNALLRWKLLLEDDGFWSLVARRIRQYDDRRLSTGVARRVRATLPVALLSINATLAVEAARNGDHDTASRHVSIIQKSGFGGETLEKVQRLAVAPIRETIKTICLAAGSEVEQAPERADRIVRRLIHETTGLLACVDIVLQEDDPIREAAHDAVAQAALECQIAFGNKTEDWRVSLELLEQTLPLAAGASLRQRLQHNLEIVRGNLEVGACWFCQQRPATDAAAAEVKLHKVTARFLSTVRWQQVTINVPRCATCRSTHGRADAILGVGLLLGLLAGLGSCSVGGGKEGAWLLGLGVWVVVATVAWGVGRFILSRGVRPESSKTDYPLVQKRRTEGWEFGEKPSGVQ